MKLNKAFRTGLAAAALTPAELLASTASITMNPLLDGIILTIIYGALGIVLATLGYKVVDLITPGCLGRDIVEGKNVALAILAASMILGICVIIAAVLIG